MFRLLRCGWPDRRVHSFSDRRKILGHPRATSFTRRDGWTATVSRHGRQSWPAATRPPGEARSHPLPTWRHGMADAPARGTLCDPGNDPGLQRSGGPRYAWVSTTARVCSPGAGHVHRGCAVVSGPGLCASLVSCFRDCLTVRNDGCARYSAQPGPTAERRIVKNRWRQDTSSLTENLRTYGPRASLKSFGPAIAGCQPALCITDWVF